MRVADLGSREAQHVKAFVKTRLEYRKNLSAWRSAKSSLAKTKRDTQKAAEREIVTTRPLHDLKVPVTLEDGRKGAVELVIQEPKMPTINRKALEEACVMVLERYLARQHPAMCKGEFN